MGSGYFHELHVVARSEPGKPPSTTPGSLSLTCSPWDPAKVVHHEGEPCIMEPAAGLALLTCTAPRTPPGSREQGLVSLAPLCRALYHFWQSQELHMMAASSEGHWLHRAGLLHFGMKVLGAECEPWGAQCDGTRLTQAPCSHCPAGCRPWTMHFYSASGSPHSPVLPHLLPRELQWGYEEELREPSSSTGSSGPSQKLCAG